MKKLLLTASFLTLFAAAPALAEESHAADHGADHATEAAVSHDAAHDGMASGEVTAVDVVDTAMSNADFSTLVTALKAADWVEPLKAEGPFTVFAPTNAAFAALPAGTLEDLLKPENKAKLQDVLKYHVVAGKVMSSDIAEGNSEVTTAQGTTVEVVKGADGVTVDGAHVVAADVAASNGVIHAIDKVLMP